MLGGRSLKKGGSSGDLFRPQSDAGAVTEPPSGLRPATSEYGGSGGDGPRPETAGEYGGGRSLAKHEQPLPRDRTFHDILGGGADDTPGARPPSPRLALPPLEPVGLSMLPTPMPPPPRVTVTATSGMSRAQLLTLIAVPALLIVNVFLIVYILVPVLSGSVGSTSGSVSLLDVLSVNAAGRVGISNPNPAVTLEARPCRSDAVCRAVSDAVWRIGGRPERGLRVRANLLSGRQRVARYRRLTADRTRLVL
jgi:hypothetical protein